MSDGGPSGSPIALVVLAVILIAIGWLVARHAGSIAAANPVVQWQKQQGAHDEGTQMYLLWMTRFLGCMVVCAGVALLVLAVTLAIKALM